MHHKFISLSLKKFKKSAYPDVLKNNATTSFVLVLHELFSMFPLFIRSFLEILGKPSQGYIITIKMVRLKCERINSSQVIRAGICGQILNMYTRNFFYKIYKLISKKGYLFKTKQAVINFQNS